MKLPKPKGPLSLPVGILCLILAFGVFLLINNYGAGLSNAVIIVLGFIALVSAVLGCVSLAQHISLRIEGVDSSEAHIDDEMTRHLQYKTDSVMKGLYLLIPIVGLVVIHRFTSDVDTAVKMILYANILVAFVVDPLVKRYYRRVGIN